MNKLLALFLFFFCFSALQAQYNIPDPAFAAKLRNIVPLAMDGDTLDELHPDVSALTIMYVDFAGISDLDGIQFFTSLEILDCSSNSLTIVDPPFSVRELHCSNNNLQAVGIPPVLEVLDCSNNQLTGFGAFPNTLQLLDCSWNMITSLPPFPNSLYDLNCRFNQISFMDALPGGLLHLSCDGNQLSILPFLPNTLLELNCSINQIISLPSLPSSLEMLGCFYNELTVLPPLPAGLRTLSCGENMISALPPLPNSLEQLSVSSNPLAVPDSFPSSLWFLGCYDVGWTDLPQLPGSLEQANISDNPISCLPWLPASLNSLDASNTNITCLPNAPAGLNLSTLGFSPAICPLNNVCFPEEVATGTVYLDLNGDGIRDLNDPAMTLAAIEALPGPHITGTFPDGQFVLPLDTGNFTVDGQDLQYHIRTTAPHMVSLGFLEIDSLNDIGYQVIPGIYDLVVDMSASFARPGFDNYVSLQVSNVGTESTLATIDFNFDQDQTWVNSSVNPDALAGNTASWFPTLFPGDTWTTFVTLHTDVSIPVGTDLDHTFSAVPQLPDTTPGNNFAVENDVVVGSFDPNDKLLAPASMTQSEVQAGTPIEYIIRFQNTGTFAAERVLITDTLSADLNWSTMDFISSSHECNWYLQSGVLHFEFDPIFLPDSTSDEPGSHGFVKFRMQPKTTLVAGTQILNVANIYFDFNEPVITDPAVFVVSVPTEISELEKPGFNMYPNPTDGGVTVVSNTMIERIEVLLLDGRIVQETNTHTERVILNIDDLANGVYLIQIEDLKGLRSSKLLLKE